jgi:colanic acid biosynthesis glycosyl transferase WcaI
VTRRRGDAETVRIPVSPTLRVPVSPSPRVCPMKVLLLNQCFWPDVVATSQQLTGLARGLTDAGHEVTVICSRRGYDNPELRFPGRESWNGIKIERVRSLALGKSSRWRRVLNFASFYVSCAARLALTRRHDVTVALTSPPLISWLASVFTRLKGGRLVFWVMDLNPDEAIAAGWLKPDSATAKVLASLLKSSMLRAERIIALDRFMKDRVTAKGIAPEKIAVIPPFSDDSVRYDAEGREAFRREHGLAGKFVVMHAGNHSPCHPLHPLLEAARELRTNSEIVFCFVGGGSELGKVKEYARANELRNVHLVSYQPQSRLASVLSAGDLHVVVMGEPFVGIVHPSKIYNILAAGRPFIYLGPNESHMGDIIKRLAASEAALQADHGDVAEVVKLIERLFAGSYRQVGFVQANEFSRSAILPKLITEIESAGSSNASRTSVSDLAQTITD